MLPPAQTRYRKLAVQAAIAIPAVVLLLIAVFVPVPPAFHGRTTRMVFDFAHFSLAAAAYWYLWTRMKWPGWAAFATVVAVAAVCELVQGFTGRCPAASDLFRGLFGALTAAICLSAFRRNAPAVRYAGALIVVIAVSAWPITEFIVAAARFCVRFTASV